jgi:hypothetical protein
VTKTARKRKSPTAIKNANKHAAKKAQKPTSPKGIINDHARGVGCLDCTLKNVLPSTDYCHEHDGPTVFALTNKILAAVEASGVDPITALQAASVAMQRILELAIDFEDWLESEDGQSAQAVTIQ